MMSSKGSAWALLLCVIALGCVGLVYMIFARAFAVMIPALEQHVDDQDIPEWSTVNKTAAVDTIGLLKTNSIWWIVLVFAGFIIGAVIMTVRREPREYYA